jgi:lambda family phage minor tail protein L
MIESDIQRLNPGQVIDLFELDATLLNGGVLLWHNGVNELGNNVVWQGKTYSRFPVEADGFERSGKGSMPRPTLKAANVSGLVGALARELNDLVGAKLTRRRTFVKYLDAVNFPGSVNVQADPNVCFADEVWSVDRKSSENGVFVEFELSASFDVQGVFLPRRQCIQNVCTSKYRGAECGYTGGPVATELDILTSNPTADKCGKRLASCSLRFPQYGLFSPGLNFSGFPGTGLR